MKTKTITIIGIVLCLSMVLSAMEMYVNCDEGQSIVTESKVLEEDYLFLGQELNFSGEAEDLIFLGKGLTFNGKTKLGLIAGCKKLVFSGEAGNGIIAGGMDIAIDGLVNGNNYIGCKSFNLSENATVNGNLFIGGAKLLLNGTLNGNLYAGAGELVINNEINGDVTAYGGRIIIGDKGKINGNLTYSAKEKLSEEELARVTGTITVDEKHKFGKDHAFPAKMIGIFQIIFMLSMIISFVVVGSLLLFIPVFRKLDAKQSEKTFWNTALWGLIPVFMYPAIIVLCFAMVVTIPFAFILILAFVPLFYIAHIIGITLTGKYLVTKFKWNVEKRHYHFLIGALASVIVSLIPFINFLATIFLSALGCGVCVSFLFNKNLTVVEQKA